MFRTYINKNKRLREYIKQSRDESMKRLVENAQLNKFNHLIRDEKDNNKEIQLNKYVLTSMFLSLISLISYYYLKK